MISKIVKAELKSLIPWVAALDLIVYGVSIIFINFTLSMLIGLALGTIVLYVDLIMIAISNEDAIRSFKFSKSESKSRNHAIARYIVRYIIIGVAIVITFLPKLSNWINTFGVVIPLFYPKLIYIIQGFTSKKKGG